MGSSEKFCLRWNDFKSNISVAFREIREEKDFFDCTLSVGDRQLQAHKLILSACSPFFKSVLKNNPHQHPLLYLKGVEFSDLQAVLNFMYHGEVNVAQEELNSFLDVAEDLQVMGLTQNNFAAESNPVSKHTKKHMETPTQHTSVPSRTKTTAQSFLPSGSQIHKRVNHSSQQDEIQEVMPEVKTEPVSVQNHHQQAVSNFNQSTEAVVVKQHHHQVVSTFKQSTEPVAVQLHHQQSVSTYKQPSVNTTSYSGSGGTLTQMEDQTVTEYVEDDGYDYGSYEGEEVWYEDIEGETTGGENTTVMTQVNSFIFKNCHQLEGKEYSCGLCQKIVRDKNNMIQHMEVNHLPKESRYSCQHCGLKFVTRRKLATHRSKECSGRQS